MASLGSPNEIFTALQGIGFLGVQTERGDYDFCHDGTQSTHIDLKPVHRVAVHPCYARALGLADGEFPIEVAAALGDDEETTGAKDRIQDQRTRQLGKALVDYEQIQPGREHANQFESWLTRAIKVLFSGPLINIELHPNKSDTLRRDVVGTNTATRGFWKRLHDDYQCRQVIFEAKNYSDLGPEEFNQAIAYGGGAYGKASFIVHRGSAGLDENERAHIKSRYYGKQHLIIILPATILTQCLKKQRSHRRVDYTEETLGKLLDTYERQYLGEASGRKRKRR